MEAHRVRAKRGPMGVIRRHEPRAARVVPASDNSACGTEWRIRLTGCGSRSGGLRLRLQPALRAITVIRSEMETRYGAGICLYSYLAK